MSRGAHVAGASRGMGRFRSDPLTKAIEWDARLKAAWGLPPDQNGGLGCPRVKWRPGD
jgi:hypothetical protein